jgi:hypothetical protein
MLLETLAHILPTLQGNFATRLPGFSFRTGPRWIQENSGGNRMVFIPLRDTFEPGRQQPGVRRVTRVRVAHVQVFIWAVPTRADGTIYKRGEPVEPDSGGRDSVGQAEAAVNALLCALEDSCRSVQYDVEGGEWADQEGESVSEYGAAYFLTFSVRIPVVYEPLLATPVNSVSIGLTTAEDVTITPPP